MNIIFYFQISVKWSEKNLFSVSSTCILATVIYLKQWVIDVFCSTSTDKSRKSSSLLLTCNKKRKFNNIQPTFFRWVLQRQDNSYSYSLPRLKLPQWFSSQILRKWCPGSGDPFEMKGVFRELGWSCSPSQHWCLWCCSLPQHWCLWCRTTTQRSSCPPSAWPAIQHQQPAGWSPSLAASRAAKWKAMATVPNGANLEHIDIQVGGNISRSDWENYKFSLLCLMVPPA